MLEAEGLLSEEFVDMVERNSDALDAMIVESRDNVFNYTALKALQNNYLLHSESSVLERPQHMFLRAALNVHGTDMDAVKECYNNLSLLKFTFASLTLFNSGSRSAQLSSCFLLPAEEPLEDFIGNTLPKIIKISRNGGGIGLGLHYIPAKGTKIQGVKRSGLIPVLKMLDAAMGLIERTGTNLPSALAVYLEPWHADVFDFVRLKTVKGSDANQALRLFYALWINDLFMERVENDEDWTLFCPSEVAQLVTLHGAAFQTAYELFEQQGLGKKTVRARDLWKEIVRSQIECGGPSILFKDAINRTNNDRHQGTITHSSPCTELIQYSSREETAVCTMASVVLPTFVKSDRTFDYPALESVVRHVVFSLNRALHRTRYPVYSSDRAASSNRAIGIGIQGLADAFALMAMPFDSDGAFDTNRRIAETIYYSAIDESCNLTKTFGVYPAFKHSPADEGWLQYDYWNTLPEEGRYDWASLRRKVSTGMCNSHVTAYMPTSGTSQFTQCTESFEPFPSLIYTPRDASGRVTTINKLLISYLCDVGMWNDATRDQILAEGGSIQNVNGLSDELKAIFKTSWEINPDVMVQMASDRAPFVCQSQSLSFHFSEPTMTIVVSAPELYQH
ncbi:hypothetical protein EST38_g7035 [Candolleomyces aberdarensis]|uniref:Ribonucleoside-diphosphate reductase n=1 Tax=Candolleomyces aberdarensis TaxID=2316362 RepID=A0A4Q2DG72_9AGAR|nr:hypothetical protein EST38_g7035 [Candolleomyces aberdarensis]